MSAGQAERAPGGRPGAGAMAGAWAGAGWGGRAVGARGSLVFAYPEGKAPRMAEQPLESTPQTSDAERAYLPPASPPRNHGHTVAAWVTVSAVMAGAVVSAVGVVVAQAWVFWLGMGVVVLGVLVGVLLRKAGLGQPEPSGPVRGDAGTGDDVASPRGRPA